MYICPITTSDLKIVYKKRKGGGWGGGIIPQAYSGAPQLPLVPWGVEFQSKVLPPVYVNTVSMITDYTLFAQTTTVRKL